MIQKKKKKRVYEFFKKYFSPFNSFGMRFLIHLFLLYSVIIINKYI